MLGMWIIPFCISLKFIHTRFLIIWIIFTILTGIVFRRATRTPLKKTTPRLVYKWFLFVHKVTYFIGVAGYVGLMLAFLGINFLFFISETAAIDCSIMLIFYGIYFGVLARDIAEICSDSMASKIGVHNLLQIFYLIL